jgi:hypothetical protein
VRPQSPGSRDQEVDFVLAAAASTVAIEVKSGRRRSSFPGVDFFARAFPVKRQLLVGAQGIPLDEFLTTPAEYWLD